MPVNKTHRLANFAGEEEEILGFASREAGQTSRAHRVPREVGGGG